MCLEASDRTILNQTFGPLEWAILVLLLVTSVSVLLHFILLHKPGFTAKPAIMLAMKLKTLR